MNESTKLYLVFSLDNGKTLTLAVPNPKDDIVAADINPVAAQLVADEIFLVNEAKVTAIKDAYVRTVEVQSIIKEAA